MAKTPSRGNQESVRMIEDREATSSTRPSVGPDPASVHTTSSAIDQSQDMPPADTGDTDAVHAETCNGNKSETASTLPPSNHQRVREEITESETSQIDLAKDRKPKEKKATMEQDGGVAREPEQINADSRTATERSRPTRRVTTTLVLAAVLVLLTGAGAVWAGMGWLHGVRTDSARDEALAAARDEAAALTSVNFQHPDQDVGKVLSNATGGFAKLFQQNRDSYTKIVKDGQVVSTGKVVGAGVETADEHSARILLAVQSKVQNKQVPNGESRAYRMVATMEKQQDGTWRVAGMEFLP